MKEIHTPNLIVGGGPVGLVLGIELATRGVPCLLVNEGKTTPAHPQGNTQNARSMEHYRRLGIAERIRNAGLPRDHTLDITYVTRVIGYELARLRMPTTEENLRENAPDRILTPEPLHRVSQMMVEAILKAHIDTLPAADVRFGWRMNRFEQDEGGVTAEIAEADSGRTETVRCGCLIGCDGAGSIVRQTLGFRYEGEGGEDVNMMMGRMLSTYVDMPDILDHLKTPNSFHFWTVNPDARAAFVAIDGKGKFQVLSKLPPGKTENEVDAEDLIRRALGADVPFKILSKKSWMAGLALVAEKYQEGRVFMAGDAVHLFTPTGGFGMNTGIDDAANLGWKLAARHQGWGGEGLLATYESERRSIAIRNTTMSRYFANAVARIPVPEELEEDTPGGERARAMVGEHLNGFREEFASLGIQLGARYDGSPLIVPDGTSPPEDHPSRYVPTACPGGRAPHFWRADGSALFDHFGQGFTLLRFGGGLADASNLEKAARKRGAPLDTVAVEEPEGRKLYERNLALIRPDGHVAWRGDEAPRDPDRLLDSVAGA